MYRTFSLCCKTVYPPKHLNSCIGITRQDFGSSMSAEVASAITAQQLPHVRSKLAWKGAHGWWELSYEQCWVRSGRACLRKGKIMSNSSWDDTRFSFAVGISCCTLLLAKMTLTSLMSVLPMKVIGEWSPRPWLNHQDLCFLPLSFWRRELSYLPVWNPYNCALCQCCLYSRGGS